MSSNSLRSIKGEGPKVVVSTAAFQARVRGSFPGLGGLKETKMFFSYPLVKLSIVGSLRDREGVLGLIHPGFEFRILCLESSVILPSSGGSPGPIQPVCAEKWPESDSFHLFTHHKMLIKSVYLNDSSADIIILI